MHLDVAGRVVRVRERVDDGVLVALPFVQEVRLCELLESHPIVLIHFFLQQLVVLAVQALDDHGPSVGLVGYGLAAEEVGMGWLVELAQAAGLVLELGDVDGMLVGVEF